MYLESSLAVLLIFFSPQISTKIYDGLSYGAYCVKKPSKCPSGSSIVCNIGNKQYQEVCISPHDEGFASKEVKNLLAKLNRKPITTETSLTVLRSMDETLNAVAEHSSYVQHMQPKHPNKIEHVVMKDPKQFLRKYYKSLKNPERMNYRENEKEIILHEAEIPNYVTPQNSPAQSIDTHFEDLKNYQKVKSQVDESNMYLPIV